MTLKSHKKHAAIARPAMGNFGRNEWALIGAPCTVIKVLADEVIKALSPQYTCAYADTSHNDDIISAPGRLATGAVLEFTDQLNHSQLNFSKPLNSFTQRQLFADADIVLVNGNHQQARAQVLIIDENKRPSLQKRVEQLTNVELILLTDHTPGIFDFVQEALPNLPEIPMLRLDDTESIINFFKNKLLQTCPKLNGLVLSGGKSVRMGFDKGSVKWYGREQRYFLADMLKPFCDEVFISCRADQKHEMSWDYPILADTFVDLGPFGAILSAFREQPDSAWLVVAADLPLLDEATIKHLADNRDTAAIATAFGDGYNGFPEPLITIWEPKSYPVLLAYLAQGYSCPRKVLINGGPTLLNAPNPDALTNVNTPEELDKVKRIIHQKIATD